MAWGRAKIPKPPPPPKSAVAKLIPLILLLAVLGGFAFCAYHIYLSVVQISDAATKKMEKKNVVFTKGGMKVGVKHIKNDDYVDKTQNMLVKAWNLSTWPGYKSRLWNKERDEDKDN